VDAVLRGYRDWGLGSPRIYSWGKWKIGRESNVIAAGEQKGKNGEWRGVEIAHEFIRGETDEFPQYVINLHQRRDSNGLPQRAVYRS